MNAPASSISLRRDSFSVVAVLPLVLFLVFSPFYDSIGLLIRLDRVMLMDWQRLTELAAVSASLLLLVGLLGSPLRRAPFSLPAIQVVGWLAFFALGALSSANAAHPRFALVEWSLLLVCFLATAQISLQAMRDFDAVCSLLRLFAWAALASYTSLYYISNSDYLFDPAPLSSPHLFGFYNIRVFSDYQTAIICLLPWALHKVSASAPLRASAWLVAGCYGALAFVTGSRSLLFGQLAALAGVWLVLGSACAAPYARALTRLWLLAALVYGVLFVLFPVLFWDSGRVAIPFKLRYDSSGRFALWEMAWQMGLAHPWLGIGPMHFAATVNPIAASPHNAVLQVLAEWGGVAAGLFVLLIGEWLRAVCRGVRARQSAGDSDQRLFAAALLAAVLALLTQSNVSPVFNNPQSQVMLVLLAGALGSFAKWPAGGRLLALPKSALVSASLFSLGVLALSCLPWVLRIEERNACHYHLAERPTKILLPRFWQQGWLYMPCEPVFDDRSF